LSRYSCDLEMLADFHASNKSLVFSFELDDQVDHFVDNARRKTLDIDVHYTIRKLFKNSSQKRDLSIIFWL
jgi:hypothetical protein